MLVRHYSTWLHRYFKLLANEAKEDPYWSNKLPEEVTIKVEVGSGYFENQTYILKDIEQKWSAAVSDAFNKSTSFMKSTKFSNAHFHKLALPFIRSKQSLREAEKTLQKAVEMLPARIISKRVAIFMRQLALAALSMFRAPRTGTFDRLLSKHVIIHERQVSLDIPKGIVKNAKPIVGPLPNVDWLHTLMIRYKQEARPLLVQGVSDSGFFFCGKRGRRLRETTIYNGVRSILGVNPQAMRYVLVSEAKRNGASDEALSKILVNTPAMIKEVYDQTDSEDDNAIANRELEKLYKRKNATR